MTYDREDCRLIKKNILNLNHEEAVLGLGRIDQGRLDGCMIQSVRQLLFDQHGQPEHVVRQAHCRQEPVR